MGLGELAADLESIAGRVEPELSKVVAKNVRLGTNTAQRIARQKSGPHGLDYYKRINDEMTGPLQGEWGPTGAPEGHAVGAGWRHGTNTDIPKSADLVAPKFAREVGDTVDGLFW